MTQHVKAVAIIVRLLRLLRSAPWRTMRELAAAAYMQPDTLRHYLARMREEGLVRARARRSEPDENGNKRPGQKPLEYRVATDWGGV
jgi:DNA-binding transcriptional ArsR family regulator